LVATERAKHIEPSKLEHWRSLVQKDHSQFIEMCIALGLLIKPMDLHPWAHWITPEVEKYRYNTLFFVAELHPSSEASHDQQETTALDWFSPEQALRQAEEGHIRLPPPTWFMLNELSQFKTLDSLMAAARNRTLGEEVRPILPVFVPFQEGDVPKEKIPSGRQIISQVVLPGYKICITAPKEGGRDFSTWRYLLLQETKSKL